MKNIVIALAAFFALVSCTTERTPEQKAADLIAARFDSLAIDCKVVSVAVKDTIRQELTTADPGYKELRDKWIALMEARVSPLAPEYKAARQAMEDYENAWIGEPIAVTYTCVVECEDFFMKMMLESGAFAVNMEHTKIIEQ